MGREREKEREREREREIDTNANSNLAKLLCSSGWNYSLLVVQFSTDLITNQRSF